MLSRLLKEHQAKQNERKELQEEARGYHCSDLPDRSFGGSPQCGRGPGLHEPEKAGPRGEDPTGPGCPVCQADRPVDRDGGELQPGAQEPHPTHPDSRTPHPTTTFQEIGDVENWARSIELDMRTIATALEYVYKGQLQSAPS
ncbi:biogenesis of lysosome-related organelles complex 1 subunit 1 isoform X1 [Delphinus delphis]|uniref:biogenesis of lysosome-related organelles complex 1 subunit 1 isoform X1 n=1 Tax=Delphinus delphis TaxID=9728 RepID=UPI0028C38599|nr:biogenesis of lysosome-related organelles complex 1 subunit 1 isoform X1 [Delphinus delphis]